MIRNWIRTSDACRTAFDIACGKYGRNEPPWPRPVQHALSSVQATSNIAVTRPDVNTHDVDASAVGDAIPTTLSIKVPSVEQRDVRECLEAHSPISATSDVIQEVDEAQHAQGHPSDTVRVAMRSSSVPASRFARFFQYGGLAVSVGLGTAKAAISSNVDRGRPIYLSESNVRRIVATLSRMRGAALKLGQFLSIQDSKSLPPELTEILARVQNAADYMPWWQTEGMLVQAFGDRWQDRYIDFQRTPIAAASIGQVHRAVLHDGTQVAVKIQFPGIAKSITADIGYIKALLTMSSLLPKGLFLDNSMRILSRELQEECDYVREAEACKRFYALLGGDESPFSVPKVIDSLSTDRILTLEYMSGNPLTQLRQASQALRDHIGELVLTLCLREIFEFRYMQTDPNWSNFLWNEQTSQLEIVDFGASRGYSETFANLYKNMLLAAQHGHRDLCESVSRELKFLTADDGPEMINAHVDSVLALAEPFTTDLYDFGQEDITSRIRSHIPTILQHRKTPPPSESYSLNRKLSGCFLLCANLGSRVRCRTIFEDICAKHISTVKQPANVASLAGTTSALA